MNPEHNKINVDLIGKYLAGEASPEEAMLLDEWLLDAENRKEFEQYVKMLGLLPGTVAAEMPTMQQSWAELESNIGKARPAPLRRIFARLAVAASVSIAILLISYYFGQNRQRDENTNSQDLALLVRSANDQKIVDTLEDGSVVTINKNSKVSYPKVFNGKARELVLSGEAYFNVRPNKSKPFIITIDELKIEVVGTSFNVRRLVAPAAIEVQVQSGLVKMYTAQKHLMVSKSQTGVYTKADGQLRLKDTIDLNSIGYATNSFYFNDILLTEACKYLSNAFNVNISIDEKKFRVCRLTAQFDNKSLPYILDVINATFNTTYTREGNTYYINGNGCQ